MSQAGLFFLFLQFVRTILCFSFCSFFGAQSSFQGGIEQVDGFLCGTVVVTHHGVQEI
jgi:hypothetical protein